MTTTTLLILLSLAHLVAFVAGVVFIVRAHRRDAEQLALFFKSMQASRDYATRLEAQPGATMPPAPVSGVHAVPTGDAEVNEDARPTMEIGMAVWAGDTGERPSVEELTTVHVPVVEAMPSLLSASSKERLARLADGTAPVYRGQPTIGRYPGRPTVADAPANVRRVKGGT